MRKIIYAFGIATFLAMFVFIPGTFWFVRFDGLGKIVDDEEKNADIAVATASIFDEVSGDFSAQKPVKLNRLGYTIATSLTNPFYGMSEAAIAQASSTSSSGTGTGNNCINQDCETPCDKDYSRPPIEKAREYINTTLCCEYRHHYFDGNGNLIEVIYKKYNQIRVCVSSDMIEWCHRCKETGNNG